MSANHSHCSTKSNSRSVANRRRGQCATHTCNFDLRFHVDWPTEPATAQAAKFLERFKDWATYAIDADAPNKRLCFAVSQPKDLKPKNVNRGDIFFYVSSWPHEGVANEVSVKIGYDFAKDSISTVQIGSDVFELFTERDKAFVESPAQEKQLVDTSQSAQI